MELNMKFRMANQILEGRLAEWINCIEESIEKINGRPFHTLGIISSEERPNEIYEKYELDFYYPSSMLPSFFISSNLSEEEAFKRQLLKDSLVEFFELQGFCDVWASTSISTNGDSALFLGISDVVE